MMKKNILFMLLGLFALVSCEKDIFSDSDKLISIEQFSPVMENGAMKLSGRVNLPAEFNRETAKVGFYVAEYDKEMLTYGFDYLSTGDVNAAYRYLMYGNTDDGYYYEDKNEFHWVDRLGADGTFEISFLPEMKQYVCIAFVANFLESDTDGWYYNIQLLQSDPFFFTGEATALLELVDPVFNEFKLSFSGYTYETEVGLCWSVTNKQPNLEDNCYISGYHYNSGSYIFDHVAFEAADVIYVRGFIRKYIRENNSGNGESYKVIYSNMIELHPGKLEIIINSKEEMQAFINSMYVCTDSINQNYDYRGDEWWRSFRGSIQFNYAVEEADWLRGSMTEDGENYFNTYYEIPELNGTIEGKGIIPEIREVNEQGAVKGMTLFECNTNNGLLENVQVLSQFDNNGLLKNVQNAVIRNNNGSIDGGRNIEVSKNKGTISNINHIFIDSNYGSLTASDSVYVESNNGLVQNCKEVIGTVTRDGYTNDYNYIVNYNQEEGRIIDCTIKNNNENNAYMICYYNQGYMENCLPNSSCCGHNYGIIKNPYSEDDYTDTNVKEYPTNMFYGTWESDSIISKEISNGEVRYESISESKSRISFQEDGSYLFYYYDDYTSEWRLGGESGYEFKWEYKNGKLNISSLLGGNVSGIWEEREILELTDNKLVIRIKLNGHGEFGEPYQETIYHKVQ